MNPAEDWLSNNDADDHCCVLRMTHEELGEIVAARCRKRRGKAVLIQGREGDPCACGCLSASHGECYWWFNKFHGNQGPPVTGRYVMAFREWVAQKFALPTARES